MPQKETFYLDDEVLSAHPLAYTVAWLYNVVTFLWMKFILVRTLRLRGPGVIATYTIQSWIMLTTRHGISAIAPFLPRQHFLLWFNEILRFPALSTATITFCYWNFVIAPVIYFNIKDEERKQMFLKFSEYIVMLFLICFFVVVFFSKRYKYINMTDFNFRMVQVHFFNIIFAVLNTIVTSSRKFEFIDLWCALAGAIGYALLYLLVLDRFGVHLYLSLIHI